LPHMLKNVRPNMVINVLWNLIETPLYKNLNDIIHHQWASLFILHMDSKFQFLNSSDASSDNSDSDNEKIHYTSINSMIHNFFSEFQK
jgi:hypothetical protein